MLEAAKKLKLFDVEGGWHVDTDKMMKFANQIEAVLWLRIRGSDEQAKLRDHFAGLAMQGLMNVYAQDYSRSVSDKELAEWSYEQADAMLKAREVNDE